MKNIFDILLLLTAVLLPAGLGYLFRATRLFNGYECDALRKFVVRVSVPFLIFKNLYKANINSLSQLFPSAAAFILMTVLFTLSALYLGRRISPDSGKQNAFIFSVFMGNYSFLGWGVIFSFYGEEALTRAVFFTMFFWPVFLLTGFWLVHRRKHPHHEVPGFIPMLLKNALAPVLTSLAGILFNIFHIPVSPVIWDFIDKFSGFTIPMILFTIGLTFQLRLPREKIKVMWRASLFRLLPGMGLGAAALMATRLVFTVDMLTMKVILIESVMPSATMTVFFTEFADIDKELHAGIIALSTLLSLITLPLWYILVEQAFSYF